MKNSTIPRPSRLLSVLLSALLFSACTYEGAGETATSPAIEATETAESTEAPALSEAVETVEPSENEAEETVSPALALLPHQMKDDGIFLNETDWTSSEDYSLFREYFFGTWDCVDHTYSWLKTLILDDSEGSFFSEDRGWRFSGFYEIGSDVLALRVNDNAESALLWLDQNDPDTLYAGYLWSQTDGTVKLAYSEKIYTLLKTDTPLNEPGEGFLSLLKLREMAVEYGIDLDLLMNIGYMTKTAYRENEVYIHFLHDDWYQFYPVYLVSEEPDKLVLKTEIGSYMYELFPEELPALTVEVRYTLQKTDGEWARSVEFIGSPYAFTPLVQDKNGLWSPTDEFLKAEAETVSPALARLPCKIEEDGVYLDPREWTELKAYDPFRECFFGTWESDEPPISDLSTLTFDDTENSFPTGFAGWWGFGRVYEIGSDMIACTIHNNAAEGFLLWADQNDPDHLYAVDYQYGSDNELVLSHTSVERVRLSVYQKTDAPIHEPAENYLSRFKLGEMAVEYGIDLDLLMKFTYMTENTTEENEISYHHYYHDSWYYFYPVYLVSKSPDRLVLKTRIGNAIYEEWSDDPSGTTFEIRYTLQKTDGEWIRSVEFIDAPYGFSPLVQDENGLWSPVDEPTD
ncbi:MAG: hypothetical protein NC084_10580 [Bacteroides sp.]|nr:hypothetical protein [Eubacterium sp.]MCM1419281.1 hypothetical protein [Roseburia sp.]MCM1463143.1 hypothetical protein [Bacteroides sp.]